GQGVGQPRGEYLDGPAGGPWGGCHPGDRHAHRAGPGTVGDGGGPAQAGGGPGRGERDAGRGDERGMTAERGGSKAGPPWAGRSAAVGAIRGGEAWGWGGGVGEDRDRAPGAARG